MKKSLFTVAILFLISSNQMLACDYYEDESVIIEILKTGAYKSTDITGKICSHDKKSFIPIKDGKADGQAKIFLTGNLPYTAKGIVEVKFKNGIRYGLSKEYYPSGELNVKVNYKNGKREGLNKVYYKSGALLMEENYKNDKRDGLKKVYYESGKLLAEGNFENGHAEGLWKYYYESGALEEEMNYKNSKREGLVKNYHESGALRYEGNYKDDKEEGLWKYYVEPGTFVRTLVRIEKYENGKKIEEYP